MEIPDGTLHNLFLGLGALALAVLSLVFSASECAFLSINKLRVRFLRLKKDDKRALLCGSLLEKKEKLLQTLLIGNNIANTALAAIITRLGLAWFGRAGLPFAIAASTVILLLFGEIGPKTIASRYPEPTAFLFSPFISLVVALFSPLTALSSLAARGPSKKKKGESFTEEEIKTFFEIGEEEGVLEKSERAMMHRALAFTDLSARDIMQPRTRIVPVSPDASYRDVLELSERSRLSRFPVVSGGVDNILGILYVKDMLAYKTRPGDFGVKKIMRRPLFIPGTKKLASAQQALRESRQSLAVVVDEYSGTAGLLSIEDIASEIFGAMTDEYGPYPGRAEAVRPLGNGEFLCDASVRLPEASEKTGIPLVSSHYETLGGLVLEQFDSIPRRGDSTRAGNAVLTVEDCTDRRIKTVRIRKTD
ncbi:MAG: hemolysin family protein [Spirochaetaceae bacterium]|jgi:CBS domain containing-hemolysin-like protein|nr:hemolysin family protein [Spirochaetaceae bacterium]